MRTGLLVCIIAVVILGGLAGGGVWLSGQQEEKMATFSLHLNTCNLGTSVRKGTNPFTGEPVEFPIDHGLTAAERRAVEDLLAEFEATDPDPDTYCRVKLRDGSVNIAIGTLRDKDQCGAFAVECSGLTTDVVSFVHALASRGNMSIGSTIDPKVVAVASAAQAKAVAKRWPSVPIVETPAKLKTWLKENVKLGKIV